MEREISNYIKVVMIPTLLQDPEEGIAVLIDGLQWEEALRLVSYIFVIMKTVLMSGLGFCSVISYQAISNAVVFVNRCTGMKGQT